MSRQNGIRPVGVGLLLAVLLIPTGATAQQPATSSANEVSRVVAVPDHQVIQVKLKTTLDAKRSKVGDSVGLEVSEDVRDAGGKILIPKKASLTGRVLDVVPSTKQLPGSRLAIVVERAQWKGSSTSLYGFVTSIVSTPRPMYPGVDQKLYVPPPEVPRDERVELVASKDPKIVTSFFCRKGNVYVQAGTLLEITHLAALP